MKVTEQYFHIIVQGTVLVTDADLCIAQWY